MRHLTITSIPAIDMNSVVEMRAFQLATETSERDLVLRRIQQLKRIAGSWWSSVPNKDYDCKLTMEYMATLEEATARTMGWIKAADKVRLPLGMTLSSCYLPTVGYSSGYWGNPMIPVGTSPQKIGEWAWSVWRRANQILQPYGWSVSKVALQAAVESHQLRRVGRVAVQLAASSLPIMFGGGLAANRDFGSNCPSSLKKLRESREVLSRARGWKSLRSRWSHDVEFLSLVKEVVTRGFHSTIADAEAEVIEVLYGEQTMDEIGQFHGLPFHDKTGITVHCCYHIYDNKVSCSIGKEDHESLCVVCHGDHKDYHVDLYSKNYMSGCISNAIRAWKTAKKLRLENEQLNSRVEEILAMNDRTFVAYTQDSLDAGNCLPGTRQWAERTPYHNAIPISELWKYRDNERCLNVIKHILL